MSFLVVCFLKHSQPKIIGEAPTLLPPDSVYCPRCRRNVHLRGNLTKAKKGKTHGHFLVHSKSIKALLLNDAHAYSQDDISFLRQYYHKKSVKEIAKHLRRSIRSIWNKAEALGIATKHSELKQPKLFCGFSEPCPFKHVTQLHNKVRLKHPLQFCLLDGCCNQQCEPKEARTQLTEVVVA